MLKKTIFSLLVLMVVGGNVFAINCPGNEIVEPVYTKDGIEVGMITHYNFPQLRNSTFSFNNDFEDDLYHKRYGVK